VSRLRVKEPSQYHQSLDVSRMSRICTPLPLDMYGDGYHLEGSSGVVVEGGADEQGRWVLERVEAAHLIVGLLSTVGPNCMRDPDRWPG